MYVNVLDFQMKGSNLGVEVDDQIVDILLYADDVVLFADHEKKLC